MLHVSRCCGGKGFGFVAGKAVTEPGGASVAVSMISEPAEGISLFHNWERCGILGLVEQDRCRIGTIRCHCGLGVYCFLRGILNQWPTDEHSAGCAEVLLQ